MLLKNWIQTLLANDEVELFKFVSWIVVFTADSAFKIQATSTSEIKCQGNFRIFKFALAMHRQKNCQGPSRNVWILRQQYYIAKSYDLGF